MEDILASIRRILSEDEGEPPSGASQPTAEERDVLPLDPSMLVEEPKQAVEPPTSPPAPMAAPPQQPQPAAPPGLLGPEAAAAAASSVSSLLRTLVSEREQVQVRSGGPTIEDLVREEIRPLLKQWLDSNLPPLVERLVRAEIERVVGRALS
jgi:cell pole-organizing protein PopZ